MTECFTQDNISQIDSHCIQTINLTIEALVNEIMRVRQTEEYNKQPVFESRLSNKLKSFIRRFSECGLGGQMNISFSKILNPILTAQQSNNSSFIRNRSCDKSKSTANCNTSFELAEKQPGVDRAKQQISRLCVAPLTKTKTYPINKTQTKCYRINANKPPLNPKKTSDCSKSSIPRITPSKLLTPRTISNNIENSVDLNKQHFSSKKSTLREENHVVKFSPCKLDPEDEEIEFDDIQMNWGDMFSCKNSSKSLPEGSTCAYSDYYIDDTIIEDPDEDTL